MTVTLSHNPSHLEFIDPVIEGRARADQTSRKGRESNHDPSVVLPVLMHGDAAFPGQGVVSETLNLQALPGYSTGGTVHVITNNQLGFTTNPSEARSTRYASDLAKGFDIPIIHVNADDVEACVAAMRLAMAFRREFGRDALIDLIGYRRYGHNETDEPAYTQPAMYEAIKAHPPVRKIYAEKLVAEGVVTEDEAREMLDDATTKLSEAHDELKESMGGDARHQTGEHELDRTMSREPRTTVPADTLRSLNEQLLRVPNGFTVHRKLGPQLEKRRKTLGEEGGIDWAQAEALSYASLLALGVPIRLTGQDSERGTFSQRHLVLHDSKTGDRFAPIQNLRDAHAPFELHNSPLSEQACLGFEYGYSVQASDALVAVGGPVRRLRQRRPGGHRPVPGLRPGQVGPDLTPHPAAARTATRARAPSTPAPGSSASCSWPPRATSGWPTRPRPPSTSICCAARRWWARPARWW